MALSAVAATAVSPYQATSPVFAVTGTPASRSGSSVSATLSADGMAAATAAQLDEALTRREYELLKLRGLTDDEVAAFRALVETAAETGDPRGCLAGMDTAQRELVRKANSYGSDLTDERLAQMSDEGVTNLLVRQDCRAFVDYNNDGIVEHGAGMTFVFPPPNAPDAVKDAWEATLAEMPRGYNRLLAPTLFMVLSLQANIRTDADGKAVGVIGPGEAGYRNIFSTAVAGWRDLFDRAEAYLDWSDKFITEPQAIRHRALDRQMLELFRGHLDRLS